MTDSKDYRIITLGEEIRPSVTNPIIEKIELWNTQDDENSMKLTEFTREPIKLHVSTYGGEVYAGLGLISAIEHSRTPVYTFCYGEAFSMGLPILVSGHRRFMGRYATVLYHEVRGGGFGQNEMLKLTVEEYDRMQTILDDILLSKTKIKRKKLDDIKKGMKDWYIPAEEAMKLGIVDFVI